ncbi:PTS lactose/cellobiose transporter subunit IIA [Gracilibacillus kekensis]|uniref:PTS system lichenan oligosaccharide-specific IIA component, Lac family n=1 Tax=Gracilibacillus kekensis TaxID=1027249 RepID=A0A1M7QTK8_9BACI|nr:PTS lactose/cellobiose transporter subunit IIA [Gracilibacillus kekensis]SHN34790.1 PTS system lichenan oligosaccharide-specific IIA component, Lac family [Gracilibacillus kekensis]
MSQENEKLQVLSFSIILHSGNAKSFAMEAIKLAKVNNMKEAKEKIEAADQEFVKAHHEQTKLLQDEASGKQVQIPLILVHAQDHLMTAMTVKELAIEMVEMYEKMNKLEEK